MNFVLKPSLEHMALVRIAISLWNQNDVRALIAEFNVREPYSNLRWRVIEERVKEKVPKLLVPQLLREKVLGFVKPIGLQVKGWMDFHIIRYTLLNLPAEFCWTAQGTVDRKKTAEMLVRDVSLDMSTRYELACIYCMEDDIIQFWNSMPEDLKESVSHMLREIKLWSQSMRRRGNHINYRSDFFNCVVWANKVAAKYFLQKLTPREREESLVEFAKYVEDGDTLCYLISEMDEEQQIEVFKYNPKRVLTSFLQWPRQSFFIEVANCMWDFLSKRNYNEILGDIIDKVGIGWKDYNYRKLFGEFWQKSPNALKDSFIQEIYNNWMLPTLFEFQDKENIRLILKDMTITAKAKLIYSNTICYYMTHSIHENEWDFLEFCIRECLPSKNEMLKFKQEFEKRMTDPYSKGDFATKKHTWDQIFSFSDDSICK